MSKLLAPNGKPSKLTPEQYKLVRTPAFKKWFGDWEKDPANASKVIDENGEPLVVYRGDSSSNKKGYVFKTGFNRMGYLDRDRLPNQYFFYFVDKYEVADAYGKDQVITHNEKVEYTGKGKKWESKVTSYFLNIKKPIDLTPKNPLFISYENYEKQFKKNIIDKRDLYQVGYRYGLELSRKELNKILEKKLGKDYLLNKDYIGRYEESFIESFKKDEKMLHTYSHFIEHKNRDYNSKFLHRFYIRMIEKKFDGLVLLEDTNWNGGNFYGEIHKKYQSGELKFDYNRWVEKPKVFACLESNQIKLADGTNTTFDGGNPDIRFAGGGEVFNNLSDKSKEIINANYEGRGSFGFYDFDYNKESERENYFEWLKDFKENQFKKNISKVIKQVESDIKLKKEEKKSKIKLKYFEELIIPSLGNEVLIPKLSIYEKQVLLDPNATIESIQKGFIDAKNIIDEDGSINQSKITPSNFIVDDEINLPAFEKFVEKNPQYKNVFNDWKKMLDEYMDLSMQKTYAFRYPSVDDLEYLHSELVDLKDKKSKDKFNTGGEVKINVIAQIWEWFGIKF